MLNASRVIEYDRRLVNRISRNLNVQRDTESRSAIDSDCAAINRISRALGSLRTSDSHGQAQVASYSSAANSVVTHATLTQDVANMQRYVRRPHHRRPSDSAIQEEALVYQVINSLNSLVSDYNSQSYSEASQVSGSKSSASVSSSSVARGSASSLASARPHDHKDRKSDNHADRHKVTAEERYRDDDQGQLHWAAIAALRTLKDVLK